MHAPTGARRQYSQNRAARKPPSARALKRLVERGGDCCTICRRAFGDGAFTAVGHLHGKLHHVGRCCLDGLETISAVGVFLLTARALDIARRAGVTSRSLRHESSGTAWSTDDRQWFAAHPDRAHRLRSPWPGEFDRVPIPAGYVDGVVVRQVEPGARARLYVAVTAIDDPGEALAHALFDATASGTTDGMHARAAALEAAMVGRPQ